MPDLIVIGSGLGGLCAAAIASRHGLEVQVLEAHSQPGGAAHGFRRGPFHFESGPSLWSGLGSWPSATPLAQVLRAVGESVPVARYSEWGLLLPEGHLRVGVGLDPFLELLRSLRGPAVAAEWQAFLVAMAPLCRAAGSLPLLALRPDAGLLTTLGSQGLGLIGQAGQLAALGGAFGPMARRHLRDPFLLHWVEMLCFLISGLEPDQTSAAGRAGVHLPHHRPLLLAGQSQRKGRDRLSGWLIRPAEPAAAHPPCGRSARSAPHRAPAGSAPPGRSPGCTPRPCPTAGPGAWALRAPPQ